MGEKDLLNCETRRIYDWDGIPLEDVFMHKDCDLVGGKKAEASDSNCTIHGVVNPVCHICDTPYSYIYTKDHYQKECDC